MKKIKIKNRTKFKKIYTNNNNDYKYRIKSILKNNSHIILIINIIINIYLLIENSKNARLINKILDNNNNFKNKYPEDDKDMIGLYYPEIKYDEIKNKLKNFNIISSLVDLINQLEIKLIYLEKEINLVKEISFYTSRTLYLDKNKIEYNEDHIDELHELINWVTIHKSNQLKGIASDKFLACKYVKLKIGKNLCPQRIAVYNDLKEINSGELYKFGDIVLKISNSCSKSFFLSNTTQKEKYEQQIEEFKKSFLKADHGLVESQFFHLYAKKRIIVEKQFSPRKDLYEFKIFIINNNIKIIYLELFTQNRLRFLIYDSNFNFVYKTKDNRITPLDIKSFFKNSTLETLKKYAIKLSEDFPNFIRVDLYLFHDEIYLSELTFASFYGKYMYRKEKIVLDSMNNFSRIDDYY